eukprot:m.31218 g.31218  ORF g.31218 m.31218 type:complete len:607 (+) comp6913_c0_seq1:110-1930(+)
MVTFKVGADEWEERKDGAGRSYFVKRDMSGHDVSTYTDPRGPAHAVDTTHAAGAEAPDAVSSVQHPFSIKGRVVVKRLLEAGKAMIGQEVVVGGWVKTGRKQGKDTFAFLEVNDGSSMENAQLMVTAETYDITKLVAVGTSVICKGEVVEPPEGAKQAVEVKVSEVLYVGLCDPSKYPISKGYMTLEKLREHMTFRSRTNACQAVFRVRNALARATHQFFQERGFLYLHAPIITSHDCEGAGEMFGVTTLLAKAEADAALPRPSPEDLAVHEGRVAKGEASVAELKAAEKPDNKKIKKEEKNLEKTRAALRDVRCQMAAVGGLPRDPDSGQIDFSKDFFSRPSYLSVSGQLDAEIYACAMTSVYTFGPTFRAEDSHTTRHLAEFWMIEPEIAFCDLQGDMTCAEQYVQYCCKHVLETCRPEMEFFVEKVDKQAIKRLETVASTPFVRLSYTEACELLIEHSKEKKVKFKETVTWGIDLGSEHERYLAEKVFKGPVILYDYPKEIKAFYMRLNDDGKTVAAMDVLVPGVGELIGGSQREEREDVLTQRIEEMKLPLDQYSWYLDLRRFGTVPHAGFGLGFERLVLFTTGMENIRDVIPFPRFPGKIL